VVGRVAGALLVLEGGELWERKKGAKRGPKESQICGCGDQKWGQKKARKVEGVPFRPLASTIYKRPIRGKGLRQNT